ncbi:hypothetical protein Tco_1326313 [Tanacetum coccineum]
MVMRPCGSPRADDHEYLELPRMPEDPYMEAALQAPPSPDYMLGPEEPEQAPPSPDYVPGPEHTDDEIVAKDQGDEDDDVDMETDGDEEEEEHPAPADSVVVALPTTDQAPSAEETEPFETDESAATPPPHPAYRMTSRISIPAPVPMPVWSDAEIPSPSLPLSPPSPVLSPAPPPSPIRSLGYRATMIRMRAEAASNIPHSLYITHHPYITSHHQTRCTYIKLERTNPKVTLPPRRGLGIRSLVLDTSRRELIDVADYGFVATMDREIKPDLKREVGYGITDSWDEIVETLQGALVSTDTELGQHMTTFKTRVRQDTDEVYTRLDDEQSQRQLLAGRLNMLFRERRAHAYTRHQMETEARLSQETWRLSMDASDLARGEVMSLRTTVVVSTKRGYSTTGTGDHLAGAGDSPTWTGGSIIGTGHSTTGTGYRTTGTTGTRWRSCIARAARGGSIAVSEQVARDIARSQSFLVTNFTPNTDQAATSPVKIEAPRELLKVSLVNASLKNPKYNLGKFDNVVKKRSTPDAITEGEWGFEHTKKCSIDKKLFEIEKKELKLENERLLEHIICQDVVNIVMHAGDKSVNVLRIFEQLSPEWKTLMAKRNSACNKKNNVSIRDRQDDFINANE